MYNFKKKTWAVIDALQKKLQTTSSYPTLGHFYREIELLKFPWMANSNATWFRYGNNGRNVYAGSQYDTIVDYCRAQGWISIITGGKNYTVSSLIYQKGKARPQKTECIIDHEIYGKLGKRQEPEKIHTEFKDFSRMEVSLALDPDLEWVIKTVNGKTYLSVKK